jgi:hypothetical protein
MNTTPYSAEIAYRLAALQGEAEVARRAARPRRRLPGPRMRHGTTGRTSLAGPLSLAGQAT